MTEIEMKKQLQERIEETHSERRTTEETIFTKIETTEKIVSTKKNSPYLEKFPHSTMIQVIRPSSAINSWRKPSKTRADRSKSWRKRRCSLELSNFAVSTFDSLDLAKFCKEENSTAFVSHSFNDRKIRGKKSNSSKNFRVILYRNGRHDRSCICTSKTLGAIFQFATTKLEMPLAARRLFDGEGQEIFRFEDLHCDNEYFVSSGENFKDPFASLQIHADYSIHSKWTMKGIQTSSEKPESFKTKTNISERLNKQIYHCLNLLIIENGNGNRDAVHQVVIDEIHRRKFEKFLEISTNKLSLNCQAHRAFTVSGEEITTIKNFFVEKNLIEFWPSGKVYGPLWISKGEDFRPLGAFLFAGNQIRSIQEEITRILTEIRQIRILIGKKSKKKRDNDSSDDEGRKSSAKSKDRSLASLTLRELRLRLQFLIDSNERQKVHRKFWETRRDFLRNGAEIERESGSSYSNKHIKIIPFDARIVGVHPLLLYIHFNGNFSTNDPQIYFNMDCLPSKYVRQTSIDYFLGFLMNSIDLFIQRRPKRVFDINGSELKHLGELRKEQHLFISFGEEFRVPFDPCLSVEFHSVDVYNKNNQNFLMKVFRLEDETIPEGEKRSAKKIAAEWKVTETIPEDISTIDYENDLNEDEQKAIDIRPIGDRISENSIFLVRNKKLLYLELKIKKKLQTPVENKKKPIFSPNELQTWFYDSERFIYNKTFDSLVLTVIPEVKIPLKWTSKEIESSNDDGYSVQLRTKNRTKNQLWHFTTDGFIVSDAFPEFALTNLMTIILDQNDFIAEGQRLNPQDPTVHFIGIFNKFPENSSLRARQRWGIRQESSFTIGDWKFSKIENPLWHKMALTWPVNAEGQMIPDLQWPVEGCLIPNVPPLKAPVSDQNTIDFFPIRLFVLKNGERELKKAVAVVGPDITNFLKTPIMSPFMYNRLRLPMPDSEQIAARQLQRFADARQREIKIFLENCTELCKLPFAGRRLFDVRGTELLDLTSIERDSYVYVTCGESWIDPALTQAEQQRRLLLAYLSNDIRMMKFYCALRHLTGYVISAESGFHENSRLIVTRCALSTKQRERIVKGESIEQVIAMDEITDVVEVEPQPRTAHERSHKNSAKKSSEQMEWPWQKTSSSAELEDSEEAERNIIDLIPKTNETTKITKTVSLTIQRFRLEFSHGYISCLEESNLVLGVKEIEGKVVEVILKRRNPDDIFQRWTLQSAIGLQSDQVQNDLWKSFFIASKARPTMVLTVLLPSCTGNENEESKISCIGSVLTLQQRRFEENGCSNQKWAYDQSLGFLIPFNSTMVDQEITAANRANICSYTVNYEALSQPGFTVSILNKNDQAEDVSVCSACAQAMRGRFRLVKIDSDKKFVCAIGKRQDIKFQGPFRCLNHKVDLTRDEAENSLYQRQEQLEQLRQEASVRNIAKELAAAKTVQTVYLLAYRNGDGHTKPGQILFGSTIIGLLDQATHRLSLTNAARRFYLEDGTVVLTIEDLIQWMENYYKNYYNKIIRAADAKSTQHSTADKSELDRSSSTSGTKRSQSLDVQADGKNSKNEQLSLKVRHQNGVKVPDMKQAVKYNAITRSLTVDIKYLLKFPVEVWVSSGEQFVPPSIPNQKQNLRLNQYEQRYTVTHDFEREKHTLRLIKGRRVSHQNPGELVPVSNPENPVIRKNHWSEKSENELDKETDVNNLRKSTDEIRSSQKTEITYPKLTPGTERLTENHPKKKRVMVYESGKSKSGAVACNGTNLEELMSDAKSQLNLMQPVVALFDDHGNLIDRFDRLSRDQLICASTNRKFVSSSEKNQQIETNAEWIRTRREFGENGTDIRVFPSSDSRSKTVDPYGPPLLAVGTSSTQYTSITRTQRSTIDSKQTVMISELPPSPVIVRDRSSSREDQNGETNFSKQRTSIQRIKSAKVGTKTQNSTTETNGKIDRMQKTSKKSDSDDDGFVMNSKN